ncbi:hypothetical protein [Natribacillus halophilus]|uniref:Uncharacterized protein n=1 Tax=Natribacillus halophilus TaxID=549003 RepID=A0A1G8JNV7_9BACI|nr:hypothetical protein [Natribacillus halophilus]SDI32761.1 hypothetical protein SAMN04488123_101318 [Natribacillus halophilus]
MKKIIVSLGIIVLGIIAYRYRYVLLRNRITRRIIIKTVMEIPPLRRRALKKYSPFAT